VCCSRCSKVLDRAGPPACDATLTKKCSRCSQLHKECRPFPVEFNARFNSLVRAAARLDADEDDESPDVAAFAAAHRAFVKELDAFVRKEVKYGGTHKPKGDELTLLLVKGIDRVGTALEGLLDLARHMVSILYRLFDVVLTSCSEGSLRSALVTRRPTQAQRFLLRPLPSAALLLRPRRLHAVNPLRPRRAHASVALVRPLPVHRPRSPAAPSRRGRRVRAALLLTRARRSKVGVAASGCRLGPAMRTRRMWRRVWRRMWRRMMMMMMTFAPERRRAVGSSWYA
jgi:hypothetical protein